MTYRDNDSTRREFLRDVRNHLEKMSQSQKDFWIISQAKLAPENGYESFLNSLSGRSFVRSLPEEKE
ncbi:MAG: hypothetical protein LUE87_07515, partial [Lachnospiraceae bacterium]|nr:hypothetical protein [Lachnospiraceae bacterium]